MRISDIFVLGGGYDYGCHYSYKDHYKDYYPLDRSGYPGYYRGHDPHYFFGGFQYINDGPARLCGSRFR